MSIVAHLTNLQNGDVIRRRIRIIWVIASFLSPQATRKAWSFWDHNEDTSMTDLKWTQDYMYGPPLDL